MSTVKPKEGDWYNLKDDPEKLVKILEVGGTIKTPTITFKKFFEDEAPSVISCAFVDFLNYYELHNRA